MHNLKLIRENLGDFKNKISKRNTKVDFDKLIKLDKKHRSKNFSNIRCNTQRWFR